MLSGFSPVQLSATLWTVAHQASLSMGFSSQEYWSGLPFPPPMHESEKWKWSHSVVSDSSQPHGLQPTMLLCPWDFPVKSTGVGCHCLLHLHPYLSFNMALLMNFSTLYGIVEVLKLVTNCWCLCLIFYLILESNCQYMVSPEMKGSTCVNVSYWTEVNPFLTKFPPKEQRQTISN